MKRIFFFGLALISFLSKAQLNRNVNLIPVQPQLRTCGTATMPLEYENWVQNLYPSGVINGKGGNGGNNNIESIFNIPVIVHVIHNNEALNTVTATTGGNLNAAQIIDQINILNKDYNGTNADTNLIPAVFKPFLGKFQVNFCLAVVNPTGGILAEPGIDRINRVTAGWSAPPYSQNYMDNTIKPASIWNTSKYLNIWVCGLSGGLLGYATFPDPGTSGLNGLSIPQVGAWGTPTNDGVVILNTAFGSIGTALPNPPYNKGRTVTHEIGHWIGLRHIWGDSNCGSDFCNDTPTQQAQNFGCPAFPKISCGNAPNGEMHMNYMDYTDDACMYMFSKDQKNRAQLILTNSPMRAALITSTVCNLPSIGNDIGITYVASPTYSQIINCNNKITPVLNLRNFGTTTITAATVMYNVDGVNTQTVSWAGSLSPSTAVNYTLPQISNLINGAHAFNATVTAPNGGADNNLNNNISNQLFSIANSFTLAATAATICTGQTATLVGSGGAVSYSWNPGAIVGATAVVSPPATTIYTLSGISGTCVNTQTTSVTVTNSLIITVTNPTTCAGTPVIVTASGGITYTWSTGALTPTISVSPVGTTVYTVNGTSGSCSGSKTATVTVNPNPTITVNSATICSGNAAVLTASGAVTYTWSTGALTASVSVSPTIATIYTVTGNNGTCNGTKTVQVNVNATPTISVNNPTICSGNFATLTASGATSYSWSNGALTSTVSVNPPVLTVYTVSGTTNGCTGVKTATVNVNATPTVNINSYTICPGGSATLTASGATSYSWSNGSILNPIIVTPGITTVYTATGTSNGCTGTKTATVTIGTGLSIIASPSLQTICTGSSGTITASGATSYTWSNGANTSSIVVTPTVNTSYTIQGASGTCTGVTTATLNVSPSATVTVPTASLLCNGGNTGSATIIATGGAAPYTYSYSTGALTQTVGSLAAGNYTAIVTTSIGCVSTKSFAISQPSALNVNTTKVNTSCGNCNGSITYTANGGTPGYSYSISPGPSNTNLCSGNYTLVTTDVNGCATSTVININSSTNVTATASSTNASCGGCSDGSASVSVTGGTGPYSYTWAPSGGNAAQANNLTAECYTVTVADVSNCITTITVCVNANSSTGIKTNAGAGIVKLYPNPTGGKVTIEFNSFNERTLEVIDVTGRLIMEERTARATVEVNLSTYATGVYYLRLKSENGYQQFKIIKQ